MLGFTEVMMSSDDLLLLPHDGFRYDLIRGELLRMTPAGGEHGSLINRITIPLGGYIATHDLGESFAAETGFQLSSEPDTVLAPDFAFVAKGRIPAGGIPKAFWPGPPDLAIEVVSPNDTVYEVSAKVDEYLRAGTLAVWIVNPKTRSVTEHRPNADPHVWDENDALDGGDVVPGFTLGLGVLFRGLIGR